MRNLFSTVLFVVCALFSSTSFAGGDDSTTARQALPGTSWTAYSHGRLAWSSGVNFTKDGQNVIAEFQRGYRAVVSFNGDRFSFTNKPGFTFSFVYEDAPTLRGTFSGEGRMGYFEADADMQKK